MRVTIDGTYVCAADGSPGAGCEHYTKELIDALVATKPAHVHLLVDVPAVCSRVHIDTWRQGGARVRVRSRFKIPFVSRHLWQPFVWWIRRTEVLVVPAGQIPWGWKGKTVFVVHDVSIYHHPEWFLKETVDSWATNKRLPDSLLQARVVVCISEFTKRSLLQLGIIQDQAVVVIPQGVGEPTPSHPETDRRVRDAFGMQDDTLLYIGTLESRKGIIEAIRAFDQFLLSRASYARTARFILAGKRGVGADAIDAIIQEVNRRWRHKLPDYVIRPIGFVTEEEKWSLLRQATTFVFPSFEEGFGRPVLEAMVAGCPVITTEAGAIPEVVGDAAMYVDPTNTEAFSLAIAQILLLEEGADVLRKQGKVQARRFEWKAIGQRFWQVIDAASVTS